MSRLTADGRILDGILAELRGALELAAREASPRRVDFNAILGVRRRSTSDDEVEASERDLRGFQRVRVARLFTLTAVDAIDAVRRRRRRGGEGCSTCVCVLLVPLEYEGHFGPLS